MRSSSKCIHTNLKKDLDRIKHKQSTPVTPSNFRNTM